MCAVRQNVFEVNLNYILVGVFNDRKLGKAVLIYTTTVCINSTKPDPTKSLEEIG